MSFRKIDSLALMRAFERIRFRYFESGTLSESGSKVKLFNYYKGDRLTDEQKAELKKEFPALEFFRSRCEYAPEMRSVVVAVPKLARHRQLIAERKVA